MVLVLKGNKLEEESDAVDRGSGSVIFGF